MERVSFVNRCWTPSHSSDGLAPLLLASNTQLGASIEQIKNINYFCDNLHINFIGYECQNNHDKPTHFMVWIRRNKYVDTLHKSPQVDQTGTAGQAQHTTWDKLLGGAAIGSYVSATLKLCIQTSLDPQSVHIRYASGVKLYGLHRYKHSRPTQPASTSGTFSRLGRVMRLRLQVIEHGRYTGESVVKWRGHGHMGDMVRFRHWPEVRSQENVGHIAVKSRLLREWDTGSSTTERAWETHGRWTPRGYNSALSEAREKPLQ